MMGANPGYDRQAWTEKLCAWLKGGGTHASFHRRNPKGPAYATVWSWLREDRNARAQVIEARGLRVGEKHHRATIGNAKVERVRKLRAVARLSVREIARRVGLSYATTNKIVYRQRRTAEVANG